jgi:hypothetical protein
MSNVENINFSSIGAMLCSKELTKEQEKDVEAFNKEYEEAHSRKIIIKEGIDD